LLEQGERPIGLPNEEIERLSRACNQLGFTTTSSFSIDQHKDLRGFPRNRTCPLADAFVTVNRYPWIQVGGSFCPDGYCSRIVLLGIERNESSHTTATSCIIGIVHQRKNTNDTTRCSPLGELFDALFNPTTVSSPTLVSSGDAA
jgi:hypothetical protein